MVQQADTERNFSHIPARRKKYMYSRSKRAKNMTASQFN